MEQWWGKCFTGSGLYQWAVHHSYPNDNPFDSAAKPLSIIHLSGEWGDGGGKGIPLPSPQIGDVRYP